MPSARRRRRRRRRHAGETEDAPTRPLAAGSAEVAARPPWGGARWLAIVGSIGASGVGGRSFGRRWSRLNSAKFVMAPTPQETMPRRFLPSAIR